MVAACFMLVLKPMKCRGENGHQPPSLVSMYSKQVRSVITNRSDMNQVY